MQSIFSSIILKMKKHFWTVGFLISLILIGLWFTSNQSSSNRITGSFAGYALNNLFLPWLIVLIFVIFVLVFNFKKDK